MAIVISQKKVQDLPENENLAIGLLLPITNGNNGYFAQSFVTIDSIKSNIKNLLLTKEGERLMHPTFGTKLWNILFENNTSDDLISDEIENTIETAIANWMPFVSINEITINKDNPTNKDKYIYNVSIKFRVTGLQDLQTLTFNIQ